VPLAYIALGSNLGDRIGQMRQALQRLEATGRVRVVRASLVYQNRAVGMGAVAADFLNAVVEVRTALAPLELLDACLDVEQQLGRNRSGAGWTPRTIDLDVLIYDAVCLAEGRLLLPHPRIAERDFVAVPLAELIPTLKINDRSLTEIVVALSKKELAVYAARLWPN